MIALAVAALALQADADPSSETAYCTVDHLPSDLTVDHLPTSPCVLLEVGGMDFLSDGRLAVSTRRGQVWLVVGPEWSPEHLDSLTEVSR